VQLKEIRAIPGQAVVLAAGKAATCLHSRAEPCRRAVVELKSQELANRCQAHLRMRTIAGQQRANRAARTATCASTTFATPGCSYDPLVTLESHHPHLPLLLPTVCATRLKFRRVPLTTDADQHARAHCGSCARC
jgi:hypothetical protein